MSASSLSPFFRSNGRTLIVPIDHGTAIPTPGLENPGELIEILSPFADGFVVNYGTARRFAPQLSGKGVCLRTDVYKPAVAGNPDHGSYRVYGAADAAALGAHAVMNMLYPHHAEEDQSFGDCASLISECRERKLPVILEALPYGIGRPDDYTPANISFVSRAAAELGADVVKTAWPGDKEAFRQITQDTYVPVIILGGAATDDVGLLQTVADSIEAGGAGVAIGRNVWQHSRPVAMVRAFHAIIHEGASASEALKILRGA